MVTRGTDKTHLCPGPMHPAHVCFLAGERCKTTLGGGVLGSMYHMGCTDARAMDGTGHTGQASLEV